jgi:N-acetyl-anhydromuramyl-L-alanine amidase AmpD
MSRIVPAAWMPECKMARLVLHWTAGGPEPSEMDRAHYHFLVSRRGRLIRGEHSIKDNVNAADDDYAAHTRRLNTGSIGVALCGMQGARERPFKPGPYPLTKGQWNNALLLCADLCERYGIVPNPRGLLMHSEVEKVLGVDQLAKWDVDVLTFDRGKWAGTTPGAELRARVAHILGP